MCVIFVLSIERLFAGGKAASLLATVGTVFIERNLNVGFFEVAFLRQTERKVLDADAACPPHAFVVGLQGTCLGSGLTLVFVEGTSAYERFDVVSAEHLLGVGEEKITVGLQVYNSIVLKEVPVALKEEGAGESLGGFLHLGVGEREPYLAYFPG